MTPKKDRKQAGAHDWSGSCAPNVKGHYPWNATFSVGIFQWVPKSRGKGLKRTAVKYRIIGNSTEPGKVYERAEFVCEAMDRGIWQVDRKSERIK